MTDTIFSNQSLEKHSSAENDPIVIKITIITATLSRMTPTVLPGLTAFLGTQVRMVILQVHKEFLTEFI